MFCVLLKKTSYIDKSDIVNEDYKYNEDLDDGINSILIEFCHKLSDINKVLFVFQINNKEFGLDVRTDLSIFLEQFLDIYRFMYLEDVKNVIIDFYEQGVEEVIELIKKEDNKVCIINENISTIIGGSELKEMLHYFIVNFDQLVKFLYPSLYNNLIFRRWLEDLYSLSKNNE
ncbi:conserved hypothetical protein [Tenacibaculum sp. 190524A02b]|uniref:Uncharacterized protein n=1 Tax=Tenacibaculum vairaonense TaxID=3137860 RepID=A0ABM9PQN9_9FLAO